MNYSEIEEVLFLTPEKRYKYFFNMTAETEQVYGLKGKKEWLTITDKDGNIAMPIWPSWEFAKYSQENQWKEYQPESIDLYEFMEYWLQGMKRDNCLVLIFCDIEGRGISQDAEEFKNELEKFLSQ